MNPADEETKPRVPQETEAALAKKSLSEINMALDVEGEQDFDFDTEARYVITDTGVPNDEKVRELIQADSTLGFEVVKMEGLPTVTRMVNGEPRSFYEYKGQLVHSYIEALFVDRSQPDVSQDGTPIINFKGMRKNEVIDPAVIKARFGKDIPFSVSIDDEGTLKVVNPDSTKKVTVLGFGDAHVAGANLGSEAAAPSQAEAVVSTEAKAESEAEQLAAEIESEIDAVSSEIGAEHGVESHEPLSTEELEKIGDKGLEAAEVEDPSEEVISNEFTEAAEPNVAATEAEEDEPLSLAAGGEEWNEADERAAAMHRHYERIVLDTRMDTADELANSLIGLESNGNALSAGERVLIDSAKTCVAELEAAVRNYENYGVDPIRTYLRRTADALYFFHGATLRFSEGEVGEVKRVVGAIEKTLQDKAQEAADRDQDFKVVTTESGIDIEPGTQTAAGVVEAASDQIKDTEALKQSLTALSEKVTSISNGQLRGYIQQLEDIRDASYSRPIDPSEIAQVTRAIVNAYDTDEMRTLIRNADTQVKTVAEQTRGAIAVLQPSSRS